MTYNRELSQFASLLEVTGSCKGIGLSTDLNVSGIVTASYYYGDGRYLTNINAIPLAPGDDKQIAFNDSGILSGANEFVYDIANGNVGLGTTIPTAKLHVVGSSSTTIAGLFEGNNILTNEFNIRDIIASGVSTSTSINIGTPATTNPNSVHISNNGKYLYVTRIDGTTERSSLRQYPLDPPWSVRPSSVGIGTTINISLDPFDDLQATYVNPDGTRGYVLDADGLVYQYSLKNQYDFTSRVSLGSTDIGGTPNGGLFFKPDGTKFYTITAGFTDDILQYELSTPWDLTTRTLEYTYNYTQGANPWSLCFTYDGSKFFVVEATNDLIVEHRLSTPWEISTVVGVTTVSTTSFDTSPYGIFVKPDRDRLYIAGNGNDRIYQFNIDKSENYVTGDLNVSGDGHFYGTYLNVYSETHFLDRVSIGPSIKYTSNGDFPRLSVYDDSNPTDIIIGSGSSTQYSELILQNDLGATLSGLSYIWKAGSNFRYKTTVPNSLNLWNAANAPLTLGTDDTERVTISGSGDVGIGITSISLSDPIGQLYPARLSILGKTSSSTDVIIASSASTSYSALNLTSNLSGTPSVTGQSYIWKAGSNYRYKTTQPNSLNLWNVANAPLTLGTNDTERLTITGIGSVGIGSTNPTSRLDVLGNIKAFGTAAPSFISTPTSGSSYIFGANTGISGAGIYDNTAGIWRLVVKDTTGRIGIGTFNPAAAFEVIANESSAYQSYNKIQSVSAVANFQNTSGDCILRLFNSDDISVGFGTLVNNGSAISFAGRISTDTPINFGAIGAFKENNTLNNNRGYLSLYSRPASGGLVEAIRIDSSQRVGIGLTTPKTALNVVGVVSATDGFNIGIQSAGVNITTSEVKALNFIGVGNTFSYNATTNTVDISIEPVSDGSGTYDVGITSSIFVSVTSGIGTAVAGLTTVQANNDIFRGPGIAYSFPSTAGFEYVIESIHVTNTFVNDLYLSARHDFNSGSRSVPTLQRLLIPNQSSVELLDQPIVANPSDIIRLQSLTGIGTTAVGIDGALDAFITISRKKTTDYVGLGTTVTSTTSDQTIFTSTGSPSVVQSIRLTNYSFDSPVGVGTTNINATVSIYRGSVRQGYLTYNLTIPPYTTIEILDKPKYLGVNDSIRVKSSETSGLSVCVSSRYIV